MAKLKRSVVGSVCKPKDATKGDYIKVRDNVTLKKGQILRLESKASQLKQLEKNVGDGKLSGEFAEKIRKRINDIPDWVRFEVVALEE